MKEYPYQNLNSESLPNEIWKEISNFEGYEISNLGRVKSIDRVVPHPRLYKQFVKGRILKQKKQINFNKLIKDEIVYLQTTLCLDGKMFAHNVRRLVYSAFISPINYQEDGFCVMNINGDGFDNSVSNLKLITNSEKVKRIFKRGRMENTLLNIDRSNWERRRTKLQKPIAQYSMQDELIFEYSCIREAHRATGFDEKGMTHTARGLYKQWKGYKWKFINAT